MPCVRAVRESKGGFLSSNAQDFIEELINGASLSSGLIFLSSNAQDFIEERRSESGGPFQGARIPEQ